MSVMDNLTRIYDRENGYKDEVLRHWINNLSQHAISGVADVKSEGLRRIDYIERELLDKMKPQAAHD